MRFLFKTSYEQDIEAISATASTASWYAAARRRGAAAAGRAAGLLHRRDHLGLHLRASRGVSLMVLVGYTGLVSLGHAAFLGIGAYAHALLPPARLAVGDLGRTGDLRSPRPAAW